MARPFSYFLQILDRAVREDGKKFLAAVAPNKIVLPHGLVDAASTFLEDGVTSQMTESVVNALEVIEINHQNPGWGAGTEASLKFAIQQEQRRTVAPKTRQVVMCCLEPKGLPGLDQFVLQRENSVAGPQSRSQFADVKWFGQVVVSPCLQPVYDILFFIFAG